MHRRQPHSFAFAVEVKPLGGPSSGMIPGIDLIIRKMLVDNIVEAMIVVPNRFVIDLAPILDPEAKVWTSGDCSKGW
jgi:hypothetical protein